MKIKKIMKSKKIYNLLNCINCFLAMLSISLALSHPASSISLAIYCTFFIPHFDMGLFRHFVFVWFFSNLLYLIIISIIFTLTLCLCCKRQEEEMIQNTMSPINSQSMCENNGFITFYLRDFFTWDWYSCCCSYK